MNLSVVQRILGLLLILFSVTMLPPLGVALYFREESWRAFTDAFVSLLAMGAFIWLPVRHRQRELRLRDGFLVVALFWVVLGIAGAAPLLLATRPDISPTDAVFEAVSGFTTTGTTVLIGLDDLPRSILYYRSQIQWLGGIGIVVLAVALLPMLGVGGMQLLRAEAPGPVKDAKLTPRITETAKRLWLVYVLLTAICAAAYLGAGMTVFDSITHAFATISTGGFSTHDANLGYFKNVVVQYIAVIFMFLGGVNFSLHFMVWRQRRIGDYLRDAEFKAYAGLMLVSTAVYAVALYASHVFSDPGNAFRAALLQAVSMQTTTGFRTDNFTLWPSALPVILILSTFIGGCAGSSSGGMKVMRWLLMWKQGQREVLQLVHPSAELPVKIGRKPVDSRVIDAVWGFFAVYVVSFGTLMVLLIATGEDQVTAFSAIAACMTNSGAALGEVSATFATLPSVDKWICVVAMLLGRLEVFPLLVLISPSFWRR